MDKADHGISFGDAAKVWTRIALLSFGGPAGQIAVMHRILVDEKKWIGEERFLHALNFCMLLPGPEAQQLATYVGWLLHKVRGGLLAGILFVLPGLVAIMALSWIYILYGELPLVDALFNGLKAAVLAIVFQAVVRIGSRALGNRVRLAVAAAAFAALFFFKIPFPLIVVAAALTGWLAARRGSTAFAGGGHHGGSGTAAPDDSLLGARMPEHARLRRAAVGRHALVFGLLWLAPLAALMVFAGPDNTFTTIAAFFSRMAVVTFGGAYAVLAYVAQEAVDSYHWLTAQEMLDGLGLAETTPGPLIMVTQFVGFLGAYRNPEGLSPLFAGTLGGLLTTWVTFVPCFLFIFVGAPFIERLRGNRSLAGALSAVTAAVVGVILNLAIWFGVHFIFAEVQPWQRGVVTLDLPSVGSFDPVAFALSAAALFALFRWKLPVPWLLAGCALAGVAARALLSV
jgi:chromate transporter